MAGLKMLQARLKGFRRDTSGASAIEFAMIAGFLSIIFLNIVDIALYMVHKMELTSAVRAGAQFRLVNDTATTANIITVVENATNLTGLTVTASEAMCGCADGTTFACGTDTCAVGNVHYYLTINASYPHTWIFLPGSATISADISIRTQ